MMQRVLSRQAVGQAAAWRSMLAEASLCRPPTTLCCCVPRPLGQRWLWASAPSQAAQQPQQKAQPQSPPHTEEGPKADNRDTAGASTSPTVEVDPLQDKTIGLFQRFKRTFKQYGKVVIPVHLVTSSVWFGTFYYAAMKGVNVVPFLEFIGTPESLVGLLRDSTSAYALTAYAMYKIATPARYTVTLGGTSLSVQYLRKHGYLSTPPPVKEYIQDKMEETKEKLTEKMEETKERFSEKMEETKELFSEKMEETKDKFSEKLQETKDKVSESKAYFRKKTD